MEIARPETVLGDGNRKTIAVADVAVVFEVKRTLSVPLAFIKKKTSHRLRQK